MKKVISKFIYLSIIIICIFKSTNSYSQTNFETGYGVKTLPGIREAIEQRNWEEAQQQIEVDAKTIIRLAEYFKVLSSSGN